MLKQIAIVVAFFAAFWAAGPSQAAVKVKPDEAPSPQWLWGSEHAKDNEDVFFRRSFEVVGSPKSSTLWASCDNELTVYFNDDPVAHGTSWEEPITVDLSRHVRPGRNVLAIKGHNNDDGAGLIAKLVVDLGDGKKFDLISDGSWKISPTGPQGWERKEFNDAGWKNAYVIGKYGIEPWGKLPKNAVTGAEPGQATPADQLTVLPGFKVELLHSVNKATEGSWVCMTPDNKGRLIVSDQEKAGLFRVTPGADEASTKVEKLNVQITGAQGLLYDNDRLYLMVNGGGVGGHGSGFYILRDTKGTDQFNEVKQIMPLDGAGEHGPHAIRKGPDGKIYVCAGNFTKPPKELSSQSPVHNYQEDLLLPRQPDGNGFATGLMAPGGWIARMNPDGSNWEFYCAGFRNPYDFDFSPEGEIFIWDADMEWDIGTPWYRPTRICMGNSGGEYGWRFGTGKWPEYYPDSLPPVVNTGLGSPTGVAFGTGAKFPARYQRALYGCDWAYGKLDVFYLTPVGAGYKASFEPMVSGKAFDVTDVVINTDGAMYVTIGGRGTQSGLYRVTYTGSESTAPAKPDEDKTTVEARKVRHELEKFHSHADAAAVPFAWEYLNSTDRYLRFAARVAIESQPLSQWQDKALAEKRPTALINAAIGLARTADKSLEPRVIQALDRLQLKSLSEEQLIEALRAYGLTFIRMGKPDAAAASSLSARIDPLFPSGSPLLDRELCKMLAYLDAPGVVSKSMALQAKANTQEEQLFYIFTLRTVGGQWTIEQRKAYFNWLNFADQKLNGGASFKNFLKHIREDAEKTLSADEKKALGDIVAGGKNVAVMEVVQPRQFVRNWQMPDLLPDLEQTTHGRNFARGKEAFAAVQCAKCHRFANEGGSIGPDLTGVGNRFTPEYVLESILLPSKVISDQYADVQIVTKEHDVIVGKIMADEADSISIKTNPLSPETLTIKKSDIERRGLSKVSPMPEGLIDVLQKDEILDLIAYLRAGGNPDDKAFKP